RSAKSDHFSALIRQVDHADRVVDLLNSLQHVGNAWRFGFQDRTSQSQSSDGKTTPKPHVPILLATICGDDLGALPADIDDGEARRRCKNRIVGNRLKV